MSAPTELREVVELATEKPTETSATLADFLGAMSAVTGTVAIREMHR